MFQEKFTMIIKSTRNVRFSFIISKTFKSNLIGFLGWVFLQHMTCGEREEKQKFICFTDRFFFLVVLFCFKTKLIVVHGACVIKSNPITKERLRGEIEQEREYKIANALHLHLVILPVVHKPTHPWTYVDSDVYALSSRSARSGRREAYTAPQVSLLSASAWPPLIITISFIASNNIGGCGLLSLHQGWCFLYADTKINHQLQPSLFTWSLRLDAHLSAL